MDIWRLIFYAGNTGDGSGTPPPPPGAGKFFFTMLCSSLSG
jgi:hypothetical protein